jgi:hypothetical protein
MMPHDDINVVLKFASRCSLQFQYILVDKTSVKSIQLIISLDRIIIDCCEV